MRTTAGNKEHNGLHKKKRTHENTRDGRHIPLLLAAVQPKPMPKPTVYNQTPAMNGVTTCNNLNAGAADEKQKWAQMISQQKETKSEQHVAHRPHREKERKCSIPQESFHQQWTVSSGIEDGKSASRSQ